MLVTNFVALLFNVEYKYVEMSDNYLLIAITDI